MAAKRTHELIPLCHPLPITKVDGRHRAGPDAARASCVQATVKVTGQTGVEMEALTAVSVACLTIYDMVKAVERGMRIEGIRLVEKQRRQVRPLPREGAEAMALLPVADALARVLDGAEPLPARACAADRGGRPRAGRRRRGAAHAAAGRRVRHGRLCGARRRRRERAGDAQGRSAKSRPAIRSTATVGAGEAARIFTGGVLPPGADTIVIQENTSARRRRASSSTRPQQAGRHIRRAGLDFKRRRRCCCRAAAGSPTAT